MIALSPREILGQVAQALPADCLPHAIVVGSLAAAYRYFGDEAGATVQTKDLDCMLAPNVEAVQVARSVVSRLLEAGWIPRPGSDWPGQGDASDATERLPLVRLCPPGSTEWNIELLGAPPPNAPGERNFTRVETAQGHFAVCSFRYLALAEVDPIRTEFGIAVARPEMMALANMLHHPSIGDERMSGLIEDRRIKRSNKDLGRVLALAWLAERRKEDALLDWAPAWSEALQRCFPDRWRDLAMRAGSGVRKLLASEEDLEEAHHTAAYGLLRSFMITPSMLKASGARLVGDAIAPLEKLAGEGPHTPAK